MPIRLHRDGIAAVLATLTAASSGSFAGGYQWPRRNLTDPMLKYPFWSLDTTRALPPDNQEEAGATGLDAIRVRTRILSFDRYLDTQVSYDDFVTLHERALTALRADANLQLGQLESGCTLNRVVENNITFLTTGTPALMVSTIVCEATYFIPRT